MGPRSIIIRLTPSLVAGYDNYGFQEDGTFKELDRLVNGELPGQEFWLGGEIFRKMPEDIKQKLAARQVHLIDRIHCLDEPISSHWFVPLDSKLEQEPGAVSLTVEIDRHAPSKTKSMLFSATKDSLTSLPDRDWLSMYERRIIRR